MNKYPSKTSPEGWNMYCRQHYDENFCERENVDKTKMCACNTVGPIIVSLKYERPVRDLMIEDEFMCVDCGSGAEIMKVSDWSRVVDGVPVLVCGSRLNCLKRQEE